MHFLLREYRMQISAERLVTLHNEAACLITHKAYLDKTNPSVLKTCSELDIFYSLVTSKTRKC